MLLTQSQVSVAASSTVVVIFTILLFLSGYRYQQQTVKGLGEVIRPRIPQPPPAVLEAADQEPWLSPSRFFSRDGSRIAYANFHIDIARAGANVNWNRLAHIQLVRSHHDVCNAIMVLAELHRLKSPARRVLLFPREWAEEREAEKGDVSNPYLASTRRLMRVAARRFHVELRPITPIDGAVEGYSVISAFALSDFDRVLTVETPGLLLDAEPLDAVLAFTEPTPLAMLHDTFENDSVHSEDLFLIQPSAETFAHVSERLPHASPPPSGPPGDADDHHNKNTTSATLLSGLVSEPPLLLASSAASHALIRSVATLHDVSSARDGGDGGGGFNQTAYLSDVAYIRFSDPKLPGPEYDVPWAMKRAARPRHRDAEWTWTKLYTDFAQKRVEICGLDLETWRER